MQAHPRYRELVEQGFAAASFVGDLGIRPLDCGPGSKRLDIRPATPSRTASSMPGSRRPWPTMPPGRRDPGGGGQTVLTLEFKLNLLRPALCQRLLCRAEVLRPGAR